MGQINIKEALIHLGGSIKLYKTLIQGFYDKYIGIDNIIKDELLKDNIEEARRYAHSMKGLAGNLGADYLVQRSKELEVRIKYFLDSQITDFDKALILENEWLGFSNELKKTIINIEKILKTENEAILEVTYSHELFGEEKEDNQQLEEERLEAKQLEAEQLETSINMDAVNKSLKILISALNTYNYETIQKAVRSQEELLKTFYHQKKWEIVKDYINDYEYERAKREILEGVSYEK